MAASALQSQLKKLREGREEFIARGGKASLLYDPSQAAQIDLGRLHSAAVAALPSLFAVEPRLQASGFILHY